MTLFFAAAALAFAQAAPTAPVDHSSHSAAQHAQHMQHQKGQSGSHDGEHECCTTVDGKKECRMMKGHSATKQGHDGHEGHDGHKGHGSSH